MTAMIVRARGGGRAGRHLSSAAVRALMRNVWNRHIVRAVHSTFHWGWGEQVWGYGVGGWGRVRVGKGVLLLFRSV